MSQPLGVKMYTHTKYMLNGHGEPALLLLCWLLTFGNYLSSIQICDGTKHFSQGITTIVQNFPELIFGGLVEGQEVLSSFWPIGSTLYLGKPLSDPQWLLRVSLVGSLSS